MILANLSPLANHLWQSTLCVVVAGLLTLVLRKNRAAVRYWIWLAASVKFLVPFSLLVTAGGHFAWHTAPAAGQPQFSFVMDEISRPFALSAQAPHPIAASRATSDFPETLLLFVWFCGFAVTVLSWLRWWKQIRRTHRAATPLSLNLAIPVMSSGTWLEPGVFGIRKPVEILPEGITERLTADQLGAVLEHELCHVRRNDNLTAAIHMVVEAVFWFYPVIWWIRARLISERERACDEDVLKGMSDARIYAEAILNVCKFYMESPLVCAAGVTGSSLRRRIEEILVHRTVRKMNFATKLLLTGAAFAAVATPIVIGMMDTLPLRAQQQPTARIAFEVASVKENKSEDPRDIGLEFLPGGRFVARNVPLMIVIATAFDLPFQSDRLTGGPDWIRRERFDIEATAEKGAIPSGTSVRVREGKTRLMLRTLLAERFGMIIRRETRDLPVYALVAQRGGPKLQKADISEKDCADNPTGLITLRDTAACHSFVGGQGRGLHGNAVSVSDLASWVSNWTDRPVVDRTGIEGLFKIDTDGWAPMRPRAPRPPGQEQPAEDQVLADPARPTVQQVFAKLGLKLESQKAPVEMFVIESIQRPSGN